MPSPQKLANQNIFQLNFFKSKWLSVFWYR